MSLTRFCSDADPANAVLMKGLDRKEIDPIQD